MLEVGRQWARLLPWAACLGGLLFHYQPFWWSGFRLTHHDLGDGRLVNFTLEHGYRWLRQIEPHQDFWRPPIFFPFERASAFTDVLLGLAPPFWLARMLGAAPDTAFQIWLLLMHCANFAAAYWLLRRGPHLGLFASTAGAGLFAAMTQVWTSHPQLYGLGYVIVATLALFRIFDEGAEAPSERRRRVWIVVFFACSVLQLWSAVYPLFFFGLLAAVSLLIGMVRPGSRDILRKRVQTDRTIWIVAALLALLLAAPLVLNYLRTASELGFREYDVASLPEPASWISIGPRDHLAQKMRSPLPDVAKPWGVGSFVFAAAAFGLWLQRRRRSVQILAAASLVLLLVGTNWFGFSLWQWLHPVLPGAGGIRAMKRLPMVWLPAAVFGVALLLQSVRSRRGRALALTALAACGLERAHVLGVIDKEAVRAHIRAVAERVDPEADGFLLVATGQGRWVADDAAWVALEAGRPAVNGRYGNVPLGYSLAADLSVASGDEAARERTMSDLRRWLVANGVGPERVQWIDYGALRRSPKSLDLFPQLGRFRVRR